MGPPNFSGLINGIIGDRFTFSRLKASIWPRVAFSMFLKHFTSVRRERQMGLNRIRFGPIIGARFNFSDAEVLGAVPTILKKHIGDLLRQSSGRSETRC
jgi:hypothetical protein